MNTLTTHRQALVDLLTGAGLTTVGHLPERPTPPVVIVSPGSPYLAPGDTFGTFRQNWTLVVLTTAATSPVMTDALDDMITRITVALHPSGFVVSTVDTPQTFTAGTATYLGTTVDVTITTDIEDGT